MVRKKAPDSLNMSTNSHTAPTTFALAVAQQKQIDAQQKQIDHLAKLVECLVSLAKTSAHHLGNWERDGDYNCGRMEYIEVRTNQVKIIREEKKKHALAIHERHDAKIRAEGEKVAAKARAVRAAQEAAEAAELKEKADHKEALRVSLMALEEDAIRAKSIAKSEEMAAKARTVRATQEAAEAIQTDEDPQCDEDSQTEEEDTIEDMMKMERDLRARLATARQKKDKQRGVKAGTTKDGGVLSEWSVEKAEAISKMWCE